MPISLLRYAFANHEHLSLRSTCEPHAPACFTSFTATDEAQKIVRLMRQLEKESDEAHATVQDLGQAIKNTEIRSQLENAAEFTNHVYDKHQDVNNVLREMSVDRQELKNTIEFGAPNGQPFKERDLLGSFSNAADKASQLLGIESSPALGVARLMQSVSKKVHSPEPDLLIDDSRLIDPIGANPAGGDPLLVPIRTSSDCFCAQSSKCAKGGQKFNWCVVNTSEETDDNLGSKCGLAAEPPTIKPVDPTGRSHILGRLPASTPNALEAKPKKGAESRSAVEKFPEEDGPYYWDYCVPPLAARNTEYYWPGATTTAHGNCRCAPRNDVLQRYLQDKRYLTKDNKLDLLKVPFNDRITVERMMEYRGHPDQPLCNKVEGSNGFFVCPVSRDCSGLEHTVQGFRQFGQSLSSSSFSGVGKRTWDFCTPTDGQAMEEATVAKLEMSPDLMTLPIAKLCRPSLQQKPASRQRRTVDFFAFAS